MEGTSEARNSRGSTSSRSDSSCDYEPMTSKPRPSSQRNRRCFMPKAIHPLSFPTLQRDRDLDFSEEPEVSDRGPTDRFWCCVCERLLSQRSPWGSRRIIKSEDMPVSGVLACGHVFHAECLDQTTPKSCRNDPPCPVCAGVEEESCPKPRNVFHWLRNSSEDVTNTMMHGPSKSTLVSLMFRKNHSLKGSDNGGRGFAGMLRKSGSFSPRLFMGSVEQGGAGSSRI